jgi:ADP-sugar diphosphatase
MSKMIIWFVALYFLTSFMLRFFNSNFFKTNLKMESPSFFLFPEPIHFKSQPVQITYQSPIDESQVKLAIASVPFKDWLKQLETQQSLNLKSILIQNIDMFGPRVGFMKFKGEVTKTVVTELSGLNGVKSFIREEKQIPNIVFMRGGSVAILVVLTTPNNKKYTLLTRQARFPIGFDHFPEIPAGMLDGNGDFKGVAAKEMEEETGY